MQATDKEERKEKVRKNEFENSQPKLSAPSIVPATVHGSVCTGWFWH